MKLRILSVQDCPNVVSLRQRLAEVLVGREDATVTIEVIDTAEQAARFGMNGSPTLLVDGIDPFAQPGQEPSMSCRLYRDETGTSTGAPSVTQLRTVLDLPSTSPAASVAAAEQDCCGPATNPALSAADDLCLWRARTTPTDPAAHAVHQMILRAFATAGAPPTSAALEQVAAANGATAAPILARLHDADVIRLDPTGAIRVAYPFSAVPTRHHVRLATGVEIAAMCAIDALGIPAMLDTDATITSTDPVTHQTVTISVHKGRIPGIPPARSSSSARLPVPAPRRTVAATTSTPSPTQPPPRSG